MSEAPKTPCVVHIIYALKAGGLENGLVNIVNRTPEDRYRHVIVCLTEADEFAERITVDGIAVIQLHKKPGHDFGLYVRLWRVLRKLNPSIVHTRNFNSLEMQFLVFLSTGAKRVHGEHGRDVNDLEGKNRKYNAFRRLMSLFVHRYIAVSQDLGGWLRDTIGVSESKISQIYNGVDQERFNHALSESPADMLEHLGGSDSVVVGTVGRLAEVKNQMSLLRAFHRLINKQLSISPKLKLVIVGDGPLRPQLEDEIASLGLQGKVWLTGNRDDIPQLLQCMTVFVLPSLGEGVSNTLLEAMACGLPLIATNVGGNPELIRHGVNGLIVPVSDDTALADALQMLVLDDDQRHAMGATGSDIIKKRFHWANTVDQYLAVYDELLGCDARC